MKINIHLRFSGDFLRGVEQVNRRLVEEGSLIDFETVVPHVTLAMGQISGQDIHQCIGVISCLASSLRAPEIVVIDMVLARGEKYIFGNLSKNSSEQVLLLKQEAAARLQGIVRYSRFGGPDIAPHITLGYFGDSRRARHVVRKLTFAGSAIASSIAMSAAGPRGTCIDTLAISPFLDNEEESI